METRKKHKKINKLKDIGDATLGGLVGFNIGVASEPLITPLYFVRYAYLTVKQEKALGLFFLAKRSPLALPMLAASPFYGAARGAQIGCHAGFIHSFHDVPSVLADFPSLKHIYDEEAPCFELFEMPDHKKQDKADSINREDLRVENPTGFFAQHRHVREGGDPLLATPKIQNTDETCPYYKK